jgi:hypothetical protein
MMKPKDPVTVRSHLLLNAVAMSEAAIEGDLDELRFRTHLLLIDVQRSGLELNGLEDQAETLVCLLGPAGSKPNERYGLALCELAAQVERECVALEWDGNPHAF